MSLMIQGNLKNGWYSWYIIVPFDISSISRRIRVVFSDGYDLEYTEQMVSMIDFLSKIDGAFVYDPQ